MAEEGFAPPGGALLAAERRFAGPCCQPRALRPAPAAAWRGGPLPTRGTETLPASCRAAARRGGLPLPSLVFSRRFWELWEFKISRWELWVRGRCQLPAWDTWGTGQGTRQQRAPFSSHPGLAPCLGFPLSTPQARGRRGMLVAQTAPTVPGNVQNRGWHHQQLQHNITAVPGAPRIWHFPLRAANYPNHGGFPVAYTRGPGGDQVQACRYILQSAINALSFMIDLCPPNSLGG